MAERLERTWGSTKIVFVEVEDLEPVDTARMSGPEYTAVKVNGSECETVGSQIDKTKLPDSDYAFVLYYPEATLEEFADFIMGGLPDNPSEGGFTTFADGRVLHLDDLDIEE